MKSDEAPESVTLPPGAQLQKKGILLKRGRAGSWDDGMVECPMVWHDPVAGRYAMVYTGYHHVAPEKTGYEAVGQPRLGLAWSEDLCRWTKDGRNPVFGMDAEAREYDHAGCSGPFIWREQGEYTLFYFGTTEAGYEGGRKTLNMAISHDLVNWKRYSENPVIEPAGDGWRAEAIWHPHIQKVGGTYYLFFNASGKVEGHAEEFIGYATSPDLKTWTVQDAHSPILVGSRKPGAWDSSGRTGDPSLYRIGDTWYMAYYSWDNTHTGDGLAMTSAENFPHGWKPYTGNPVLRVGAPGSYDSLHAGKPFIYRNSSGHYHFYTAVDDKEVREIALAVDGRAAVTDPGSGDAHNINSQ